MVQVHFNNKISYKMSRARLRRQIRNARDGKKASLNKYNIHTSLHAIQTSVIKHIPPSVARSTAPPIEASSEINIKINKRYQEPWGTARSSIIKNHIKWEQT